MENVVIPILQGMAVLLILGLVITFIVGEKNHE